MHSPLRRVRELFASLLDAGSWWAARHAVDVVRYRPTETTLALACAAGRISGTLPVSSWLAELRGQWVAHALAQAPHALLRQVAGTAGRWAGPTGSALVRWTGGAIAAALDRAGARSLQGLLSVPAQPAMLTPHLHEVTVLAVDMRGFSRLTSTLRDTGYVADLVSDYLTVLTEVVEAHRGVVFQYTGDGLLAVFLPELAGQGCDAVLDDVVTVVVPELHRRFDALYARWRADWRRRHRRGARIGLGTGASFGWATLGFMGPSGKKHVGVLGEPVNTAAFLCSQAPAGTLLVDDGSFQRSGCARPAGEVVRIRSHKPHQRVRALRIPRAAG